MIQRNPFHLYKCNVLNYLIVIYVEHFALRTLKSLTTEIHPFSWRCNFIARFFFVKFKLLQMETDNFQTVLSKLSVKHLRSFTLPVLRKTPQHPKIEREHKTKQNGKSRNGENKGFSIFIVDIYSSVPWTFI